MHKSSKFLRIEDIGAKAEAVRNYTYRGDIDREELLRALDDYTAEHQAGRVGVLILTAIVVFSFTLLVLLTFTH